LFDNVGDFFKAMVIFVVRRIEVRDHEESTFFKEDYFVRPDSRAESLQTELELIDIRQQDTHDLGPSLIQGLVPNRSTEALSFVLKVVACRLHNAHHFIVKSLISQVFSYQIHLMNQDKDFGIL